MTEVEFDVFPPGLRGLNRLATSLNALMAGRQIADWHLARWNDRHQTRHGIVFDNDDDAVLAKINCDEARGDMANAPVNSPSDP
jgi:hypothetical protein